MSREADLDLIAIGATNGACNAGSCKGASQNNGLAVETLTLDPIVRGDTLYFVVDGATSAASAFTISVDCTKQ